MPTDLLTKYGQAINYADDEIQSKYRSELGKLLNNSFNEVLDQALFSNSPVYLAYKAGVILPHKYNSIKYRQANLDYLAEHHPEFLI